MRIRKALGCALALALAATLASCSQIATPRATSPASSAPTDQSTPAPEPEPEPTLEPLPEDTPEATSVPTSESAPEPSSSPAYTTWSEAESPNYVRLVGDAQIDQPLEAGQVVYSPLDALGRTGQVRACITYQMMQDGEARERGEAPDPSGWPSQNFETDIALPTGKTYQGWFWNRCHLLAKSLGGSDDAQNLVTGTRMLNVGANDGQGGMDMFETAIRSWLESYPNVTVQYVATPLYDSDEPICRSVMVDVLSSDGAINERLEVYNAAKGHEIDYATGAVHAGQG